MEPTLMSQRPFHEPDVMTFQAGVCQPTLTPRRLAISVATAMSKPFHVPVASSYDDCGGYFGAVDTTTSPRSQISASTSPVEVLVAQTPVPPPDGGAPPGASEPPAPSSFGPPPP